MRLDIPQNSKQTSAGHSPETRTIVRRTLARIPNERPPNIRQNPERTSAGHSPAPPCLHCVSQYFLDKNTAAGYKEFQVPYLVNEDSGFGTGQLPDKEGQMYHISEDGLYLIPTAEVPLTNLFRNQLLEAKDLPICLTSYTPCFRREAGSYGSNVRGLNRLHQFDKVEIVRLEEPQNSRAALDKMIDHIKGILEELELPYRILKLCGGDLGFTAALTFDFEVYSTAQKRWLEISSVSTFNSFQSERLQLRYKDENGKKQTIHTLNGSSLALPRVVAGLLENQQTQNGINIPKALIPYTGFETIK